MENNSSLAPICLFVYSRLTETKRTVESLQKNKLAADSHLFIFSDGAKNMNDNERVLNVREYIYTINGFANVTIYESKVNMGLANSIISGVSKIVNDYEKVIVLEDDLILATNFLCFMNQALTFYEGKKKVFSVSGFSFQFQYSDKYQYDVTFSMRASSWGWAIWKDRWEVIDWELKDYSAFRQNLMKRFMFNRGGSDLSRMLHRQVEGKIDSWAIRFVYHQYKHNYLDVFPIKSKVINNGFTSESTHTKHRRDRFDTVLDVSEQFTFSFLDCIELDKSVAKQFNKHYSYGNRLKDRFLQILWKISKYISQPAGMMVMLWMLE